MPNYEVKFSLDEKVAAYIDALRGSATPDDFFRRSMEIGICQLIENTARMNLDYLMQTQTGATGDYRILRSQLFAVAEPKELPPQEIEANQAPDIKDPMMGLKPRVQPRTT